MSKFDTSPFDTSKGQDYWMTSAKPLAVGFNNPPALVGKVRHGLPAYAPRKSFLVDEYPACPDHWMRSAGKTSSYFIPVRAECGMWLDFNQTLLHTPQHVALVVSVQGINAITGLPCNDEHLEQYLEKCPRHKTEFGPGRFCKDCNYRWPKQNYLASTGTPHGALWIDGFRAVDGAVRQYVFTKDTMRGVAKAVIGEKRVFAVGVSCFLSKTPRPAPVQFSRHQLLDSGGMLGSYGCDSLGAIGSGGPEGVAGDDMALYDGYLDKSAGPTYTAGPPGKTMMKCSSPKNESAPNESGKMLRGKLSAKSATMSATPRVTVNMVQVQQVEVAAGEEISQDIHDDPQNLDFWQTSPESILVINYALEVDVEKILAGGKISLAGDPKGFMQGISVGQP